MTTVLAPPRRRLLADVIADHAPARAEFAGGWCEVAPSPLGGWNYVVRTEPVPGVVVVLANRRGPLGEVDLAAWLSAVLPRDVFLGDLAWQAADPARDRWRRAGVAGSN